MNFWKEQRVMEARSRLLFVCFIVTVTLCVFAPYFIIHAAIASGKVVYHNREGFPPFSAFVGPVLDGWRVWRYPYFPIVAFLVLLPVLWGALRLFSKLRKGGSAVAEMMNALPVSYTTGDFHEKRLLNVVEEMSIASGVPMPKIYVLADEPGINAITAGFSSNDAVICATRGATELLRRDELQGVVAHEFSHILTGDIFLHTLTLGLMHGFFVSGEIKNALDVSGGSSGYFLRDMIMLVFQLLSIILFLPLWLWLYTSLFGGIGKMVKAGFFRKREFLADTNAARFTRYPAGLADTMKKILAIPAIQSIRTPSGDEANHLFFYEPLASPFSFLVSSHPSIEKRIRKLDPDFDGNIDHLDIPALKEEIRALRENKHDDVGDNVAAQAPGLLSNENALLGILGTPRNARRARLNDIIGNVATADVASAAKRIGDLSEHLGNVVSSVETAQAYVFSLLLDDANSELRTYQLNSLKDAYSAEFAENVESTWHTSKDIPVNSLVILLERCVVMSRELSRNEYDKFRNACQTLILSDDEITLLEYSITAFVKRRLDHHFGFVEQHPALRRDLIGSPREAELLISIISWAGADSEESAECTFAASIAELPANLAGELRFQSLKPFNPTAVDNAVSALSTLRADDKELLFNTCLAVVEDDEKIMRTEWEIIRLFAMMIGCPLPAVLTSTSTKKIKKLGTR